MIIELDGKRPFIVQDAYIAPNATIIGNVTIGKQVSVWFGAVIRGDEGKIEIGARTSVQDNVVIHVNSRSDTIVEENVTIGHGAVLEGCKIGAGALIGMNATILSGAIVGAGALVAAGAVVGEGQTIPPNTLAAGVPAKVKRPLSVETKARLAHASEAYVEYGRHYLSTAKMIE